VERVTVSPTRSTEKLTARISGTPNFGRGVSALELTGGRQISGTAARRGKKCTGIDLRVGRDRGYSPGKKRSYGS
jgi:hypothetical protein